MRQLRPRTAKPVLRSNKWMMQRASMVAKGKTSARGRAAVKPATTAVKPRTLARARGAALPTAASPELSRLHNLRPPGSPGGGDKGRSEADSEAVDSFQLRPS